MSEKKDPVFSQVKQIGALTAIPILLVLGPLIGYSIGNWVDQKMNWYPWATITMLIMGFVASGREIFSLLKQVWNAEKK